MIVHRILLALLLASVPSIAYAMSVADFVAKADALKVKGMMAMLSSDVTLLQAEVKTASASFREEQDAAVKAGRKPAACLPPKGQGKISSDEVLDSFRAIPAAARSTTSVKSGWASLMASRFPCPK